MFNLLLRLFKKPNVPETHTVPLVVEHQPIAEVLPVTEVKPVRKITRDEVLMGRDREFPLTPELENNLEKLLVALNKVRDAYGKPMIVSSGYRPGHFNTDAGGAKGSAHLTCEACDFRDPDGELDKWCLANQPLLAEIGLRLENPTQTKGWCHLDTRFVNRVLFRA